jgi:hypothetical protein
MFYESLHRTLHFQQSSAEYTSNHRVFPKQLLSRRSVMPSPVIFLVHGTFARNAPWTQNDSPLVINLKKKLGGNTRVEAIEWSGRNSFTARQEAADIIVQKLNELPQDAPVAFIAHSHGGSALAYAAKKNPEAFQCVRASVMLATPFFGFSARPGYKSLLLAIIVGLAYLIFQLMFALDWLMVTIFFQSPLDEKILSQFGKGDANANVSEIIELLLFVGISVLRTMLIVFIAITLWTERKGGMQQFFDSTVERSKHWDTTTAKIPNSLFIRSMGDEVGLGLGTLQLIVSVINRILLTFALAVERFGRFIADPKKAVLRVIIVVVIYGISGIMSFLIGDDQVTTRFTPSTWIWEEIKAIENFRTNFSNPLFANIVAIFAYLIIAFFICCFGFSFLIVISFFFGWLALCAFGSFSLPTAIMTELGIEPTPEGYNKFYNVPWSRDMTDLQDGREGLRHSDPYSTKSVIDFVSNHIDLAIQDKLTLNSDT